ncbi:14028_t:CDS:1 [Ambispora leptoticha]|uniref:14028_t:CDS:1 n=1 Tax=Ambispora leptoticha TaxID=144679 RepID=A0A9N8ZDK0_9GLOM|nr:14028_t:CDS:1 [Ambispora leptoticha]
MPSTLWAEISSNFFETKAIIPLTENNLLLFSSNNLYILTDEESYEKVNSNWSRKIAAATKLENFVYAIDESGILWKIDLSTYVYTPIGGTNSESGYYTNTKALVSCKGYILAFCDYLWKIYPDGKSQKVGTDWGDTCAAVVFGDYVFAVTTYGRLYRISLDDYSYEEVSGGWDNTRAILSFRNNLLVFMDKLFRLGSGCKWKKLSDDIWEGVIVASCATDEAVYVVDNTGKVYRIQILN